VIFFKIPDTIELPSALDNEGNDEEERVLGVLDEEADLQNERPCPAIMV